MPPSHPRVAWKHLGEHLVRRRIELNPRYKNRRTFTAERGVEYRIVNDIELGNRDNYEPATLIALEVAYELMSGAIGRFLDGGELEAQGTRPPPLAPLVLQGSPDDATVPSDAAFRAAMEPLFNQVAGRVIKARDEHWELPPGVPLKGEWVFTDDPVNAGWWDDLARRGRELTGRDWSDRQMAQMMAQLWVMRGEQPQARRA